MDRRIYQTMFDHQRTGVRWLFGAYSRGGGILGDDPGLGKTIQVIAVLEAVIRARLATRILVVAPANLVKNWASEFAQWVGKGVLSVVALSPDDATGLRAADRLAALTAVPPPRPYQSGARGLSPHMVVIISYETLHAHGSVLRSSAGVDLLIADEAHRLRNGGERALALRAVPAASRLLLTATSISNCMEDFYTLVDLARPGRLGTRLEFEMDISVPLAAGRMAGASEAEVALAELAAEWMHDVAADVMLRRTGADLDRGLPQRHDFILMCRPTALQRQLHAAAVEFPGLGALAKLGALRVIHAFPLLLDADEVRGRAAGQDGGARKELLRRHMPKAPEQPRARMLLSGKLQVCAALLDAILETTSERVVVVSNSLGVLSAVRAYVEAKTGTTESTLTLIGSVHKKTRALYIKKFNRGGASASSLRVCLLSVLLCEGITLIGANHLILMDVGYNPTVDEQALGRIHRPGQQRPCWHYRLASTGSLDETILDRQAGKASLLETLASGKIPLTQSEDAELLFTLDAPTVASRLHATVEEDAPYAQCKQWRAIDLTERTNIEGLAGMLRPVAEVALQAVTLWQGMGRPTRATGGPLPLARTLALDDTDEEDETGGVRVEEEGTADAAQWVLSFVFERVRVPFAAAQAVVGL